MNGAGSQASSRSVSFSATSDVFQEGSDRSTPVSPTTAARVAQESAPLKPAIKQNQAKRNLPPRQQYQHKDPLLRRLRLTDGRGKPVDLAREFQGVKVVGFYFGSQWAGKSASEYDQVRV